jgi:hypothetical protein
MNLAQTRPVVRKAFEKSFMVIFMPRRGIIKKTPLKMFRLLGNLSYKLKETFKETGEIRGAN